MEGGLSWGLTVINGGFPADFDAREQIGLGANGFKQTCGFETVFAKDLIIGVECHLRAAPVRGRANFLHWTQRDAA